MNDLERAQLNGVAPWDQYEHDLCNDHVAVFRDRYPVTSGHLLFVPRSNTDQGIATALSIALTHGQHLVLTKGCDGFNVGLNMGTAAGQTVMYPHVHLIPRRTGDMTDPRGGVRHVIPEKGKY
jgi:diadenosine tetraphosphate (Ap4A) HIT family hydrolase